MLIRRLVLDRYGAFEGLEMALGPRLTVVVGPNEAGKSTALSAMGDLLWGVPMRSSQSFRFARNTLQLSATIELVEGGPIQVVRRAQGLFSPDGAPVECTWGTEDARTQTRWRTGFGLSHAALRAGGIDVCTGRGDLAELVFTARSGVGVHDVLERLENTADSLYKGHRGNKGVKLRKAFQEYVEIAERLDAAVTRAGDVVAARQELETTQAAERQADTALREHQRELRRLEERAKCHDDVRRLAWVRAAHAALTSHGPILDGTDLELYDTTMAAHSTAVGETERLTIELLESQERLAELTVEAGLLVDQAKLDALHVIAEARQNDSSHATTLRQQADADDEAARAVLVDIVGGDDARSASDLLGALGVPADLAAQLDQAAETWTELHGALMRAERNRTDAEAELRVASLTAPLADDTALAPLLELLATIDDAGSAATQFRRRLADRSQAAQRRRQSLIAAGALDPDGAPPPVPSQAAVREACRRLEDAGRAADRLDENLNEAGKQLTDARSKLESFQDRDLVDPQQLDAARRHRDALWQRVSTSWLSEDGPPVSDRAPMASGLTEAITASDSIADRLRADADQVTQRQALRAAVDAAQLAAATAGENTRNAMQHLADAESDWRRLWDACGVAHPPVDDAEDVRRALADAQSAHTEWTVIQAELDGLGPEVEVQTRELRTLLADAGRPRPDGELESLVLVATRLRTEHDAAREDRARRDVADKKLERTQREEASRRQELRDWQVQWDELLAAAGLPGILNPAGWRTRSKHLATARALSGTAQDNRRKAAALAAEVDRFTREIEQLGTLHAPGMSADPRRILSHLWERLTKTRENRKLAEQIEHHIAGHARELARQRQLFDDTMARLDEMRTQLGLDGVEELADAAARGREAAALREREGNALELLRAAINPDTDIDQLCSDLAEVDAVDVAADLRAAKDTEPELIDAWQAATRRVGELSQTVLGLQQAAPAAELRAEAAEQLALVGELAARYAVVNLQRLVLREQLADYGRRHASPLLDEAGLVLEKLTAGRYLALRATDDGTARVLAVLRSDAESMQPASQLSEGTADQVFLALRLAGIAQRQREYAAAGLPSLPVVLDDVLVTFDDDRATAALGVLADFAAQHQVVLFTHHDHVAALAEGLRRPEVAVVRLGPPKALESRDPFEIRLAAKLQETFVDDKARRSVR